MSQGPNRIIRPSMRDIRVYTTGARRRSLLQEVERYEEERRAQRKRIDRHARLMSPMMVDPYRFATAAPGPDGPDVIFGSDLVAWYRAWTGVYTTPGGSTLVSADGDVAGRWEDQSGNGYHLLQPGGLAIGQWRTGTTDRSHGTIEFVNTSYSIPDGLVTTLGSAGVGEMWLRGKLIGPAGAWSVSSAGAGTEFYWSGDNHIYDGFGTNSRKDTGISIIQATIASAFWYYHVYSAAGDWASSFNGSSQFSTASNTVNFLTTGATFYVKAYVSEIVFTKVKSDSTQNTAMDTYLTT